IEELARVLATYDRLGASREPPGQPPPRRPPTTPVSVPVMVPTRSGSDDGVVVVVEVRAADLPGSEGAGEDGVVEAADELPLPAGDFDEAGVVLVVAGAATGSWFRCAVLLPGCELVVGVLP